jgi:predicted RNA-binding Zn-ribbon protein involved in translation (DUF1610 family)
MRLSPLTRSNMQSAAWIADCAASGPPRPREVLRTRYCCPHCDDEHDEEEDAVECCEHLHSSDADTGLSQLHCPVCGEEAITTHGAADCCLWKDLPPAARWRIATAVEGGTEWSEAIAKEAQ